MSEMPGIEGLAAAEWPHFMAFVLDFLPHLTREGLEKLYAMLAPTADWKELLDWQDKQREILRLDIAMHLTSE